MKLLTKKRITSTTKGFTLIELLIVIGILAILATTVVLVLNPAQILQETRDTQRISDLGAVQSALGLYLATASSLTFGSGTSCGVSGGNTVWRSSGAGATIAAVPAGAANVNIPFAIVGTPGASLPATGFRNVDGTGWVSAGVGQTPAGFNGISGGSPLGSLPTDPSSNSTAAVAPLTAAGRFYAFQRGSGANALNYEINANMESAKFSNGGSSDVESTDGGDRPTVYELGTDPGLDL